VDGAAIKDEGSSAMVRTTALGSAAVGMTFGSIAGRTTLAYEPASTMAG